jgi:hypothetical protein
MIESGCCKVCDFILNFIGIFAAFLIIFFIIVFLVSAVIGFCYERSIAIAMRKLKKEKGISR